MIIADKSYPVLSWRVDTPDGRMIVNFIEDHSGRLIDIHIHIGKTGYALAAWVNCVSLLLRMLLEAGKDANDILLAISNITTHRVVFTEGLIKIRSGVDGLSYAIMQYTKHKYYELKKEHELDLVGSRPIFRNRFWE